MANDYTSMYIQGIAILTLALVLSGLLGVAQERTNAALAKRRAAGDVPSFDRDQPAAWEESMFYLHFLSMPMFLALRRDIYVQARAFLDGPKVEFALPYAFSGFSSFNTSSVTGSHNTGPVVLVPSFLVILAVNTFTGLFCSAGVNRLTARVSSLTVTLILVVRKAVSLIISEVLFNVAGRIPMNERGRLMLWSGAFLVFAGSIGYSLGGPRKKEVTTKKEQ